MHFDLLQEIVWLIPTCIEVVIVVVMFRRKLWHFLPWFMSYLVFAICRTCALFPQRHNAVIYFLGYWFSEPVANVLQLCVIKELFDRVFELTGSARQLGIEVFRWSLAALLFVAIVISWNSPGGDVKRVMAGIYIVKGTVAFVEAGLLGLLAAFMVALGISLRNYYVGVFIGLTVYGAVDLVAIAVRAKYGSSNTSAVGWITMIGDIFRVATWAAYILPRPLAEPALTDEQRRSISEELEKLQMVLK